MSIWDDWQDNITKAFRFVPMVSTSEQVFDLLSGKTPDEIADETARKSPDALTDWEYGDYDPVTGMRKEFTDIGYSVLPGARGGSTDFTMADIDRLSKKVPNICMNNSCRWVGSGNCTSNFTCTPCYNTTFYSFFCKFFRV